MACYNRNYFIELKRREINSEVEWQGKVSNTVMPGLLYLIVWKDVLNSIRNNRKVGREVTPFLADNVALSNWRLSNFDFCFENKKCLFNIFIERFLFQYRVSIFLCSSILSRFLLTIYLCLEYFYENPLYLSILPFNLWLFVLLFLLY